ncbi:MAG: cytidine deaminase [Bacteroidales bacterium]|jgi:cytidine deaminase|nr:cytidine deaminase [Bacteroidales bacterium]
MQQNITISYDVFDRLEDLSSNDQKLLKAATEAAKGAYALYSKFHVGAAVLVENGDIIVGNNQENLAYPSGLCAERVAAFSASALHPNQKLMAIAITAFSEDFVTDKPIPPCGACRQVLIEYEIRDNQPMRCILRGSTGQIFVFHNMHDLLPLQGKFLG